MHVLAARQNLISSSGWFRERGEAEKDRGGRNLPPPLIGYWKGGGGQEKVPPIFDSPLFQAKVFHTWGPLAEDAGDWIWDIGIVLYPNFFSLSFNIYWFIFSLYFIVLL